MKKRYEYRPIMNKEQIKTLQQLISDNWYLSLDELGKRIGVSSYTLYKLLLGYSVGSDTEKKIVNFFKTYKGE